MHPKGIYRTHLVAIHLGHDIVHAGSINFCDHMYARCTSVHVHVMCVCMCLCFTSLSIALSEESVFIFIRTKTQFLYKAEVWHYLSWLPDMTSNLSSSRLNQAFQKHAGINGDQQTHSPLAAQDFQRVLHSGRWSCARRLLPRAKLLDK